MKFGLSSTYTPAALRRESADAVDDDGSVFDGDVVVCLYGKVGDCIFRRDQKYAEHSIPYRRIDSTASVSCTATIVHNGLSVATFARSERKSFSNIIPSHSLLLITFQVHNGHPLCCLL